MRYLILMLQLRSFRVGVVTCVLSVVWLAAAARESAGSVLHYPFEGKVSAALSAPFGLPVTNGALLLGNFSYDNSVLGVQGSTPATMRYDQPYALNVTFGPGTPNALTAAVNGYRIEVTDNSAQPGGVVDMVSLVYSNTILPASGFTVNGVPKTAGLVRINFSLPAGTFAAPILPPDFNSFTALQPTNFFADTPTGSLDVIYSVRLTPEPGSIVLIAWGAVVAVFARKRLPFVKRTPR